MIIVTCVDYLAGSWENSIKVAVSGSWYWEDQACKLQLWLIVCHQHASVDSQSLGQISLHIVSSIMFWC